MKTAICFTGTGRSLKYTSDNIKKFLIDTHEDCDVFAHTTITNYQNDIELFFSNLNTKYFCIEHDEEIDIKNLKWQQNWPAGPYSGDRPKQTYLNMLLSRKKCGEALKQYSTKNHIKYDKVIFSRLDVKYYTDIPQNLDLDKINVPDFHNFDMVQGAGCNDRFAISNLDNMLKYYSLFDRINEYAVAGGHLHAESTLRWHLDTSNLKIKKNFIRFGRVRPNGKEIDLRLNIRALEWRDQ